MATPTIEATHAYQAGHWIARETPTSEAMPSHAGAARNRARPAPRRRQPRAFGESAPGGAALFIGAFVTGVMPPLWHGSPSVARYPDGTQKDEEEPEPEKPPEDEP